MFGTHGRGHFSVLLAVLLGTGCDASSSADGPAGGAAGAGATGGSSPSGGAAGAGAAAGTGGAAGSGATGGTSGAAGSIATGGSAGSGGAPIGLASLGSLVVLGDSISDGGGQGPFYYALLSQDLKAKYGAIQYKNNAQSGSKTSALKGQVDALPASLPGPVAVCITSGGNDMKAELPAIIAGLDGAARATMGANIDTALSLLLAPGRFGAGVEVHVYEANIYDSSDGQGNFGANGCAFGKNLPAIPTGTFFANWNTEIAQRVGGKTQNFVDIHALFANHGFNHPPNWYANDCTHPNSVGHDQLRRRFYQEITGESLP